MHDSTIEHAASVRIFAHTTRRLFREERPRCGIGFWWHLAAYSIAPAARSPDAAALATAAALPTPSPSPLSPPQPSSLQRQRHRCQCRQRHPCHHRHCHRRHRCRPRRCRSHRRPRATAAVATTQPQSPAPSASAVATSTASTTITTRPLSPQPSQQWIFMQWISMTVCVTSWCAMAVNGLQRSAALRVCRSRAIAGLTSHSACSARAVRGQHLRLSEAFGLNEVGPVVAYCMPFEH